MAEGLERLASVKEKELSQLRQQQAQQTANTIRSLEAVLQKERENTCQLQADFTYNLSLLQSRDKELSHYEASFVELKRVINALMAENSELKIRLDGICKELEGSKDAQLQLKAYYQSRIKEIHSRMDNYRHAKQKELDSEHDKLEELQRTLERRLLDLEGESQCQHDQLIADFDQILKQRDREHQLRVDQVSSAHLAQESRCHQLERELARAQTVSSRLQEEAKQHQEEVETAQREEKGKVWRLEADKEAMSARMKDLEEEKERISAELKRKEEYFQKKHAELDRAVREKETNLKAAKEVHSSREHSLEQQCLGLQGLVEQREGEWQQREAGLQQTVRDKEELIQRVYTEQRSCQSSHEKREKEFSRIVVEKDLQIQSLTDTTQALQREVHRRDTELAEVHGKVSESQDTIQNLELSHAQQRLDWEGRVREIEKLTHSKQQDLIRQLTEARNKVSAECLKLRSELEQQTQLIHTVQTERDGAIATLRTHGLSCDDLDSHVSDLRTLQTQNEELRGIIKQMRVELEQLSDWSDHRDGEGVPTANYVRYMEEEVRKVKKESRKLSEQLQQRAAQRKPPTPNSMQLQSHSPTRENRMSGHNESPRHSQRSSSPPGARDVQRQHQGHLIALSDTIASLQREKGLVENQAQEWRRKVDDLQGRLKEEQEMVYILKVGHVPQSKLHQKLIQATQVIIALVREKEHLTNHINTLLERAAPSGHQLQHQCTQTMQTGHERETKSCPTPPEQSCPTPEQTQSSKKLHSNQVQRIHVQRHIPISTSGIMCAANPDRKSGGTVSSSSALDEISPKIHGHHHHQPKLDTDTSLASLQFTESSSMDGMSLEQVVELLDRNLGALDTSTTKNRVRHSTPDHKTSGRSEALEMVGRGVKTHVKPGIGTSKKTTTLRNGGRKNSIKKDVAIGRTTNHS